MELCLVFTPDDPEMYTLNPSAWLILELCNGRTEADIATAYHAAVEPVLSRAEARSEVRAGIADLVRKGIVEAANARRRKGVKSRPTNEEATCRGKEKTAAQY